MKRTAGLLLAIVLTLGGVAGTSQAAKGKKVKTEVEIEGVTYLDAPPRAVYFGDVHALKSKCERRRHVTVYYDNDPGPGDDIVEVGEDTTDRTGDFEVSVELIGESAYHAIVDKRKVGKAEKRLVCKKATSPPFYDVD